MAEINNTIYVGGGFTGVQQGYGQTTQNQSFLAAFDRDTGNWISTFRPTFNKPVLALQVSRSGKLLVGGEFTTVNGVARKGLVALNPTTGATDPTFTASIDGTTPSSANSPATATTSTSAASSPASSAPPATHGSGTPHARRRHRTTRLHLAPRFMGGVWDLAIDPIRNRVGAVGSFSSIEGLAGTYNMGVVTRGTGTVVTGLTPYQYNQVTEQHQTIGITYANNAWIVAGEQHSVQVLSATTNARLGWMNTGFPTCPTWEVTPCPATAGGAYQVVERFADGKLIIGCHCWQPYLGNTSLWNIGTFYNSFEGTREFLYGAQAIRSSDFRTASRFVPGLRKSAALETWNVFVDSRGCYYIGGYYTSKADGTWLGGFGRMCEPVAAPTNVTGTNLGGSARLAWTAPNSQLPVTGYRIQRNGTTIGETSTTTFTVANLAAGTYTFTVAARDKSGRFSTAVSVTVTVTVTDNQAPNPPPGVAAALVNGKQVKVTWNAATDLPNPGGVGVASYWVVRDWTTQWLVPASGTRQYIDTNASKGTRRYQVFAVDRGNRISAGSTPVTITVP
ncbi:MAG: hypothetical protein IPG46_11395 [Actinobacteria bacterium]|nr:hypothetical protein [Actinomycetota bacterium]